MGSVSLIQLHTRLSTLERNQKNSYHEEPHLFPEEKDNPITSSFLNIVETKDKRKKEQIMEKVKIEALNKAHICGVNIKNIMDVITFVIEFVEKVVVYVPDIVLVVGNALKGDIKLDLAINLITSIVGDISDVLPISILNPLINNVVDLKFNQKKLKDGSILSEVSQITTTQKDIVKSKKKNSFLSAFGIGRKR